jgi:CRISPR-associated endonuclease/helicase Cas3
MEPICLAALDSRYATQEELDAAGITPDQIPPGWRIMAHQAATIQALRSGHAAIIVNEARTGDGKTFAGQFPLFADGWKTLTMYPTNELAADQQRSLNETLRKWTPPFWAKQRPEYAVLNADKLDELQEALTHLTRPEAVRMLLDNELTLTNPDIFHLLMQLGYMQYGTAKDLLLGEVASRYRMFVFDEFHQFGSAQAASVMIALLLMREITQGRHTPRFLFLSATPQDFLESMATKISLKVEHIKGTYEHGQPEVRDGWRRILQPASLYLYPGKLEAWIAEHLDDVILRFCADQAPAAKGVIIANGIATAHRVHALLREPCEKARIRLGINTGITPRGDRDFDVDLLVATSTIDVGVDFKINLLIYESLDYSTHMQRLGRLGRHTHDTAGNQFARFEAHAILPQWVVDGLTPVFPPGSETARCDYEKKLREVFPPLQQFEKYAEKWAGVQAAQVITALGRPEIRTQYEPFRKHLNDQYKALFPGSTRKYRSLIDEGKEDILDEATSFRGGSPFTALVLDAANRRQTITPYNLVTLLKDGELESERLEDFYALAARHNHEKALKRANPLAAYTLRGWLPQPRVVEIYIDRVLDPEHYDVVLELDRVHFKVPNVPGLDRLNRTLEERRLVALLIRLDADELRKRLRLGYQLEIFNFTSAGADRGCIVFARDALLVDSVYWRKRTSNDSPYIY